VLGCYLLHFDRPIHRAQHYLGWSTNITARVALHQRGKGARLVAQALSAGIGVDLVRVWPEVDRAKERALKRGSGPKGHCPTCRLERKKPRAPALLPAAISKPRAARRPRSHAIVDAASSLEVPTRLTANAASTAVRIKATEMVDVQLSSREMQRLLDALAAGGLGAVDDPELMALEGKLKVMHQVAVATGQRRRQ
jgi:predicted GIY-YIG superfamily endonuclease